MVFVNPLDLEMIFINIFSGSWMIFIYVAMFGIAAMAAYFRMSNINFFIFLGLFGIFMAAFAQAYWFYVLTVIVGGFAIYFVISKLVNN